MVTEVTDQYVFEEPVPGAPITEHIRATIDTGTGGAGSLTAVSLKGNYGEKPFANGNVESTQGEVGFSTVSASSIDVDLANAPASSTITVDVVVTGQSGVGGR